MSKEDDRRAMRALAAQAASGVVGFFNESLEIPGTFGRADLAQDFYDYLQDVAANLLRIKGDQ